MSPVDPDSDERMKALLSFYRYYASAEVMRYEWHRYNTRSRVPWSGTPERPFPAPPDPREFGPGTFSRKLRELHGRGDSLSRVV
jgi:hypothetical protein